MGKNNMKKVFKGVWKYSEPIVTDALSSGASRISDELNDVVSDANLPTQILLERIAGTLKNGAITTGKDMMVKGLESIEGKQS